MAQATAPLRNLPEFLGAVTERSLRAIDGAALHESQGDLLRRTVLRYEAATQQNPLGNPLSLVYLIARAWDGPLDEPAVELAAFANLYLLAADLIDDVQDDDLAGTPHAHAGPAIATNSGLTLLFLGLDRLRRAGGADGARLTERLELFNRVSLRAVDGQHRDLLNERGAATPTEVLAMHEAKTSSLALLSECGALIAGVDPEVRHRYRRVGEAFARLVQVLDDLRDLFGKDTSPDLALGRRTYPLACFFEDASPHAVAELERLTRTRALPELRELLYESGAVRRSALALDAFRREIHHEIAAIGRPSAAHRTLLDTVDGLVSSVYRPQPVAETLRLWTPSGSWHREVHARLAALWSRLEPHRPPPRPRLLPWHLPQWVFDAEQNVVRYPDLEEQAREIAPFSALLLGTSDLDAAARTLAAQAPAVLAHECFHYWRAAAGRLTREHWHEEYVANRLAIAYCQRHEPAALAAALALAERVLARFEPAPPLLALIRTAATPGASGSGYRTSLLDMAVAQLAMVRELAAERLPLEVELARWLTTESRCDAAE
jgi:geranylgeranyl pyrophosphate synthase